MAGKLSFAIAINLITEQFKRGANDVKAAFRSIQMQTLSMTAALGAGSMGFSELVSRMIDTAKEANRANTALKNVSDGAAGYASNVQFLVQMSKTYGLEINQITENFAKLTAAASVSGMSMENQRKIFESVSRAVTAFGLSAADSNGVFLALSQMMSKGKVSSEELRLQMGERLPVAMQAMAKAAGTTVAGLDDLLKKGEVMSADVLPRFADALNEMIPNVDTDNLATSLNRLSNTFTKIVEKLDVAGKYKKLVDAANNVLDSLQNKMEGIIAFVATMFGGKLIKYIYTFFDNGNKKINQAVVDYKRAEEQKVLATKNRIELEKKYLETYLNYEKIVNGKRLATAKQLNAALLSLEKAKLAERQRYNEAIALREKALAVQSMSIWTRASSIIVGAMKNLVTTLKTMFASFGYTALFMGIASLVSHLVNIREESERIKNIFSEYKKEAEKAVHTNEIAELKTLQKLYDEATGNKETQTQLQKKIEELVGKQIEKEQDINKVIEERIKLLEANAKADYYARKKVETEERNFELGQKTGIGVQNIRYLADIKNTGDMGRYNSLVNAMSGRSYFKEKEIYKAVNEYIENIKVINDATGKLEEALKTAVKIENPEPVITKTESKEETELQKQQKNYAQALRELEAKRKVEYMTVEDYNRAMVEVTRSALIGAMANGDKSVSGSSWAKDLAEKYRQAMVQVTLDTTSEILDGIQKEVSAEDVRAEASPILKSRDTTFDYKKSQADILREELDLWKEYQKEVEQEVSNGMVSLVDDLNNAIQNVDSLEEQLKIAQVQEDIEDLQRSLNEGLYSGIKDIAFSSDRIVSSFESLRDVLNDVDATGWEKIMAIWNAIINSVDGIMSVIHTIENLSKIAGQLSGAKQSEEELIAGKTAEIAANQVATEMEIQNSKRKTEAAITEMAAKSTAAYAGIPFAGTGLAAAQIAAMTALIEAAKKNMPKFANGGIITGGPYSGDKVIARMNAGEMVLTTAQQSRLFKMLNGEGGAGGRRESLTTSVNYKVRGRDLLLAINNELKSQGKPTIS